nr:hypothetical protein CFP56_11391 [Quercus suber]
MCRVDIERTGGRGGRRIDKAGGGKCRPSARRHQGEMMEEIGEGEAGVGGVGGVSASTKDRYHCSSWLNPGHSASKIDDLPGTFLIATDHVLALQHSPRPLNIPPQPAGKWTLETGELAPRRGMVTVSCLSYRLPSRSARMRAHRRDGMDPSHSQSAEIQMIEERRERKRWTTDG